MQLFERTSRGVELMAAGEAFVQEARRALTAAERTTPGVRRLIVIADGLAQARGWTQPAPVHTAPPT